MGSSPAWPRLGSNTLQGQVPTNHGDPEQSCAEPVLQVETVKSRCFSQAKVRVVQPRWKPQGHTSGNAFQEAKLDPSHSIDPATLISPGLLLPKGIIPFDKGLRVETTAPALYPVPRTDSSIRADGCSQAFVHLKLLVSDICFAMVLEKSGPFSACDQQLLLKVEPLGNLRTVTGSRHDCFQSCPDLCLAGSLLPCSLEVTVDLLKHLRPQLLHS